MSNVDVTRLLELRQGESGRLFEAMRVSPDLRRWLARSRYDDLTPEKGSARQLIMRDLSEMFGQEGPRLKMLTLPGPFWVFEKRMLRRYRQKRDWVFVGLEKAPKLFKLATAFMPNSNKGFKCRFSEEGQCPSVTNSKTAVLINGDIHKWLDVGVRHDNNQFDAIWLDLNAPIHERLLGSIGSIAAKGFLRSPGYLVVSFQVGRETLRAMRLIEKAGGRSDLIRETIKSAFAGSTKELHCHRYGNGTQFIQIGFKTTH